LLNPTSGSASVRSVARRRVCRAGCHPDPNPDPNPDGLCDADCHAYCESLDLQNPVDVALCPSIWGVGKATRPIDEVEACRRLYADLAGYFPSLYEIERSCVGQDLGEVARRIIRTQDYVDVQRRLWADRLRYNDLVVNVERFGPEGTAESIIRLLAP